MTLHTLAIVADAVLFVGILAAIFAVGIHYGRTMSETVSVTWVEWDAVEIVEPTDV